MNIPPRFRWLSAAILFGVVLGVAGVYLKRSSDVFRQHQEAVPKLQAMESSGVDELKEIVATGQPPENVAGRIYDYTDRIGEVASTMGAAERKPLLAAQRVFAQMAPQMAVYEKTFKELDAAGGSSPATLGSQEVIRDRIAMVKRFQVANHALLEFYRSVETSYRVELDKEGLTSAVKSQVMNGFRNGACVDVNLTIRESDEKIAVILLKLLELFSREWGDWKVQDAGELAFEHDVALTEYHVLQDELRAVSARQQAAQKELLKRTEQQQKQKRPGSA